MATVSVTEEPSRNHCPKPLSPVKAVVNETRSEKSILFSRGRGSPKNRGAAKREKHSLGGAGTRRGTVIPRAVRRTGATKIFGYCGPAGLPKFRDSFPVRIFSFNQKIQRIFAWSRKRANHDQSEEQEAVYDSRSNVG